MLELCATVGCLRWSEMRCSELLYRQRVLGSMHNSTGQYFMYDSNLATTQPVVFWPWPEIWISSPSQIQQLLDYNSLNLQCVNIFDLFLTFETKAMFDLGCWAVSMWYSSASQLVGILLVTNYVCNTYNLNECVSTDLCWSLLHFSFTKNKSERPK